MSDKGRSWRQTKGRPEFIGIDFPGGRAQQPRGADNQDGQRRRSSSWCRGVVALGPTHNLLQVALISLISLVFLLCVFYTSINLIQSISKVEGRWSFYYSFAFDISFRVKYDGLDGNDKSKVKFEWFSCISFQRGVGHFCSSLNTSVSSFVFSVRFCVPSHAICHSLEGHRRFHL